MYLLVFYSQNESFISLYPIFACKMLKLYIKLLLFIPVNLKQMHVDEHIRLKNAVQMYCFDQVRLYYMLISYCYILFMIFTY